MAFESIKLYPLNKNASAGGASGRAAYLKATYKLQSWGLDNESPAIVINLMPRGAGSLGSQDYDAYKAEVLGSFKHFGYGINEPTVEAVETIEISADEKGN